jgi:hypothetical protein
MHCHEIKVPRQHLRAGRKSLVESDLAPRIYDWLGWRFDDQFIVAAVPERVAQSSSGAHRLCRNRGGIWRIKFCYDADQPLSMSAEQASSLATDLN